MGERGELLGSIVDGSIHQATLPGWPWVVPSPADTPYWLGAARANAFSFHKASKARRWKCSSSLSPLTLVAILVGLIQGYLLVQCACSVPFSFSPFPTLDHGGGACVQTGPIHRRSERSCSLLSGYFVAGMQGTRYLCSPPHKPNPTASS